MKLTRHREEFTFEDETSCVRLTVEGGVPDSIRWWKVAGNQSGGGAVDINFSTFAAMEKAVQAWRKGPET